MQNKNRIRPWRGWSKQPWERTAGTAGQKHGFLRPQCVSTMIETFRCLKRSQAAAGAQPFDSLSNFMGCIPDIRVSTFGSSKNRRFCAQLFFEPNSTGMLDMCNAGETLEQHWRNYTSCLWNERITIQSQTVCLTLYDNFRTACSHYLGFAVKGYNHCF